MHSASTTLFCRTFAVPGLVLALAAGLASACRADWITNVVQLRQAAGNSEASHSVRLEGDLWWANPAANLFVFHDASGTEVLEINIGALPVRFPQRIRLEGNGTAARRGAGIRLGAIGPVVANDGIHGMVEKSGAVYLTAGRQPIRVEWFNGVEGAGLEVAYEGPSLPRQKIPDEALWRGAGAGAENGLNYRGFEGIWEVLPEYNQLAPAKMGIVKNFDLSARSRAEHAGLQFDGFLTVPQDGVYRFYIRSDDGSRLFAGKSAFTLEAIGPATFPEPRHISIGQTLDDPGDEGWVSAEGKVTLAREQEGGLVLELSAGGSHLRVEVAEKSGLSATALFNSRIRAAGFCRRAASVDGQHVAGILYVPGRGQIERMDEAAGSEVPGAGELRVLTTAAEVHRLKREEAGRGLPVKLRGVVTSIQPEHQAFMLQDATRGLYVVDTLADRPDPARIGEFLEVEGTTDPGFFAPMVNARRVTSLGAGHLPEPARPGWEQLLNGSLDGQYVELAGIITGVRPEGVTLLTQGGIIRAEVRATGMKIGEMKQYENALVRIRGCLFAAWDYLTHQVKIGEIRIYDADFFLDQAAPADLFSAPGKTAADLLLFDPQAGPFRRVRVSGQIVCSRAPEYFVEDRGRGFRFAAKEPVEASVGDVVEVVGFPDLLANASPVLREAVLRRTSHQPLPEPRFLPSDDLLRAEYDSTRVRVAGVLVGGRRSGSGEERILEMQNGVRTFTVRLAHSDSSLEPLSLGCRLELTGVYAALGGNRVTGQGIASFELLVASPPDIRVLARPPWWTLERLLIAVGGLVTVLAATALWIWQLRRQVEERTAEVELQTRERQNVEHQRALEQERARIARDLHDELGSGITEISMLAARAKSASAPDTRRSLYLEQMSDRARELVTALDEIVWAMNPRHDSLASLVSYFSLYADRFLGLANIAWKLEEPAGWPDVALDSQRRHQLFLAFKEALTNVVRHSQASEVRLGIRVENHRLSLTVADNGRGLGLEVRTEQMDGVASMKNRVERLGGWVEMDSKDGAGTSVQFSIPII